MSDNLAIMAERIAELANEAETKKEANQYWKQYREIMIQITGDKNMFKKKHDPAGKPSHSLWSMVGPCPCGSRKASWQRCNEDKYKMPCECNSGGYTGRFLKTPNGLLTVRKCHRCGKEGEPQYTGPIVRFHCLDCKRTSEWSRSNEGALASWLDPNNGSVKNTR